jgi:hydroxyacylglutathione hydrolase
VSISQTTSNISISAIKAFSDNYIWCIKAKDNQTAVLVDPGDADVCIAYLEKHRLTLTDILITHRHSDHVGGVNKLKLYCERQGWPLTTYGPTLEATEFCQVRLKDDDTVFLKHLNKAFTVIDVPGHTLGHIAYIIEDNLFCGDTLFSAGCGRVFDGTYEQLHHSLNKLANLPEKTRIYCAHEYTLSNINFALAVEPDNSELINFYNQTRQRRENNEATIPSTIGVEKKINPFLRCHEQTIKDSTQQYCAQQTPGTSMALALATFTVLRKWKNEF